MKNKFIMENKFLQLFLRDYRYRTILSTYLSFMLNIAFAVSKMVMGIIYHSNWLKIFAGYYTILILSRFIIIHFYRRQNKVENKLKYEYTVYGITGGMLLVLSVSMLAIVWMMLFFNGRIYYSGFLVYAVALYTMYKVIMSVKNLIRAKKEGSPILSAIRRINHADALISLISLQSALLSFGNDKKFEYLMNAVTGSIVCTVTSTMAVSMIIVSVRKIRRG